ncbi:hypothetical protein [Acidovorax sp. K2F]|uniref:hypothetical protein n=1 Tax=Acidovorax sp. K2F TaxID=2978125 RepID=UPI0021B0B26C|nr:hypothetical protein [Acidovorax sp. K2F]MCT6721631.1 hypothetical protein [Acidovorax sp. K2F]
MTNNFTISFYDNSNGVTVGSLQYGDKTLLATTHPATIAYALQAMGVKSVDIKNHQVSAKLSLSSLVVTKKLAKIAGKHMSWMEFFFIFFRIDSYKESVTDKDADIHLRTAIHFLPKKMVKNQLLTEAPPNWKDALENRKQYIYYPHCR